MRSDSLIINRESNFKRNAKNQQVLKQVEIDLPFFSLDLLNRHEEFLPHFLSYVVDDDAVDDVVEDLDSN